MNRKDECKKLLRLDCDEKKNRNNIDFAIHSIITDRVKKLKDLRI